MVLFLVQLAFTLIREERGFKRICFHLYAVVFIFPRRMRWFWFWIGFLFLLFCCFLFFGKKRKNSNFDASYILNQLFILEIMSSQNDFKKDSTFVKILKSIP